METRIDISVQENLQVHQLFNQFTAYCNILGYLAKYGSLDTDLFDKKWAEAVELNIQLEELKAQLSNKYHPQDNIHYDDYVFDFSNHQIVYINE